MIKKIKIWCEGCKEDKCLTSFMTAIKTVHFYCGHCNEILIDPSNELWPLMCQLMSIATTTQLKELEEAIT